jgi:hypothetical protein
MNRSHLNANLQGNLTTVPWIIRRTIPIFHIQFTGPETILCPNAANHLGEFSTNGLAWEQIGSGAWPTSPSFGTDNLDSCRPDSCRLCTPFSALARASRVPGIPLTHLYTVVYVSIDCRACGIPFRKDNSKSIRPNPDRTERGNYVSVCEDINVRDFGRASAELSRDISWTAAPATEGKAFDTDGSSPGASSTAGSCACATTKPPRGGG